ncbi:multidrug effflux MFS transporter [Metabacillus litoralis]|uniref:multidrug effflux MFS transporter n=1 Tax=Metabacillus litoralis TaxID=152268 RepID=UPI0020417A40|nr:multidrug effflux MFS transporter [Metabacillus litoralis]MCM3411436.1 multidrug effflux MFS transporter [Metabacillus litoralis]
MELEQQKVQQQNKALIVFILGTLAAFAPLSIDMYLPAFPILTNEFHTSASMIQLSLTFFLLGASLGQLFTGPLSDVFGRRKPLLIGLSIYAVTSLLCVFTDSIELFILLRLIQGLAGSAGMVISRAIVRDLYSGKEMTKFFSLLALVNGMAPILAPVIGAQLLKLFPWQAVFIALTIIGVVIFAFVLWGLKETLPVEARIEGGFLQTLKTFRQLLTNLHFMGYVLSFGFVAAAMFAYISGSSFVIQYVYGASADTFSIVFAINGIGIVIASQVTGKLSEWIEEKKLLLAGVIMSFTGGLSLLLLILLKVELMFILPSLFLTVSSVGVVNTTSFSLALQNNRNIAGSASALLGVMSLLVGAIVAPLVGVAGEDTAVPMGIVIFISSLGAVLSYFFLVRSKKLA